MSCDEEVSTEIMDDVWVLKLSLQRDCQDTLANAFVNFDCDFTEFCHIVEYDFEDQNSFTKTERVLEGNIQRSLTESKGTYVYHNNERITLCDSLSGCVEYNVEFYKRYMDWTVSNGECDLEMQFTRK